jgi:hypothetical protein
LKKPAPVREGHDVVAIGGSAGARRADVIDRRLSGRSAGRGPSRDPSGSRGAVGQDPHSAAFPDTPRNALAHVAVDQIVA